MTGTAHVFALVRAFDDEVMIDVYLIHAQSAQDDVVEVACRVRTARHYAAHTISLLADGFPLDTVYVHDDQRLEQRLSSMGVSLTRAVPSPLAKEAWLCGV